MNDDQIKHMVNRFLGWRLPENFSPDAGISFKATHSELFMASHGKHPMKHEPVGTNLFDAIQAEAMVRHMLEGLPTTDACKTCGGRQTIRIVNDLYRADHDLPCPTCIGWPVLSMPGMVMKAAIPTDDRCPKCGGTHPGRYAGACDGPPTPSSPPPHRMQG